ncbi:ferredoxin--NADP reductase [Streptomyces boluensis]|uniref:2Fe-2S iron-sulfur cluster binding domain-containing protein n=1 Tax=Streptomyces boluensis TaxID=1775135 RepID=A0A964UWX5_9ACTN|nr:ferredoxin--NADP reductase [Streptomyces boluensis]NBE55820.1 2Fe-2S iron-sulfur cluster binding domain-containing protein [Streptomyces boluensis]
MPAEPTGGARTHRLRVTEVIVENADTHSLVLQAPPDATDRFGYRPGQFLTLKLPGTDGGWAARCYSLSSSPHTGEPLKITVKRVIGGRCSNWVCDEVRAGDEIEALPPAGTFTPDSLDTDLLLVAGGSGITPVLSIAKSALSQGTGKVALLYANRDDSSVVFRDELWGLTEAYPERLVVIHWLELLLGLPGVDRLAAVLAPYADRDAYVCGPGPMMDVTEQALRSLGTPARRIHRERFFSLSGDVFDVPAPSAPVAGTDEVSGSVRVELDDETHTVPWPSATPLLDALLAGGVDAPFSCREGSCAACTCRVVSGEVKLIRNEVLDEQDLADGYILACQAVPLTERVEVTYS